MTHLRIPALSPTASALLLLSKPLPLLHQILSLVLDCSQPLPSGQHKLVRIPLDELHTETHTQNCHY